MNYWKGELKAKSFCRYPEVSSNKLDWEENFKIKNCSLSDPLQVIKMLLLPFALEVTVSS